MRNRPESTARWLHHRTKVVQEITERLKRDRSLSFAELNRLSGQYGVPTSTLLRWIDLDVECMIDYQNAMIKCK